MCSKLSEYRPIIGFEEFYLMNKVGTIKALDREFDFRGEIIMVKENKPIIKKSGSVTYAILRDKNLKNRKVNITLMIKNLFGRQKPIVVKHVKKVDEFVKPINHNGRSGIPVEQYEDGKKIGVFPTFAAAARAVGGDAKYISDAAYGKRKYYAGYKWKFKNKNRK